MEIAHLKIIQTLAADPHLGRAAQRLHLTQSALSKRLRAIEEEIGCTLFERRGPRGLKALPQASELAGLADRVSTTWEAGLKRIRHGAAEPRHFLLVGPQLFLRETVLPWWNGVAHEFPDLEFEVRVSPMSRISIEALQGGANAAVLEHQEELADFVCRPIYEERWGVVRHPAGRRARLEDYEWGTPSLTDNPVDQWLIRSKKMTQPARYRMIWNDITALARWIAETPGAASVLPYHAVAQATEAGRLVHEPLSAAARSRLYLAYERDGGHGRLIKRLQAAFKLAP